MTRKLNVQTPGEAPATEAQDAPLNATEVQMQAAELSAPAADPTIEELQALLGALQAENKRLAAANADKDKDAADRLKADEKAMDEGGRMISRADRAKFLTMHSSQVDAKKLMAPVLCKDGWLAPDQSDQPPRR